jgi:dipeptidyl aminopeptidase/acylaminoacyl peptidase
VSFDANRCIADFSVAENGTLVTAEGDARNRFIWFDRQGHILDTVGDLEWYRDCVLSPNGQYLAADLGAESPVSNTDVWVHDLGRDVRTRLTFAPGTDDAPVWSPDGSYIYFSSGRGAAKRDLYCKPSSGAGEEQLLLTSDRDKYPTDCTADGKHLVFFSPQRNGSGDDIWVLPLAEGGVKAASGPLPFLQTEFSEDDARFSPDGRWLAYWSNETGRGEVYVRPFPGPGGKWQISTEPGDYPRWRGDGRELFYITDRGVLMAVDVSGTGPSFEAGRPRPLFSVTNARSSSALNSPFDVTANGQRFIAVVGEGRQVSTINIVLNWDAELRTK